MFADYFQEALGAETLQSDKGFCIFIDHEKNLHIEHYYILPEHRGQDEHALSRELIAIARKRGKNLITASCDQENPSWRQSLKGQLNVGFKISAVVGTVIYTYLDITLGTATQGKQQGES